MIKIKLCGLSRESEILTANDLLPDYIGFVLYPKSKRYVEEQRALKLKSLLVPEIRAVGVFVDEDIKRVAALLKEGLIDAAQLHGNEDDDYIKKLAAETGKPVIKAFRIHSLEDIGKAAASPADHILLDSGAGSGRVSDWELLKGMERPYFLAGGLSADNVAEAMDLLHPYGVDVSSGIETDGLKDIDKMRLFVKTVREKI